MNSQLQGPGIPMDQLMNTNTLVQRQQREIAALAARCAGLERLLKEAADEDIDCFNMGTDWHDKVRAALTPSATRKLDELHQMDQDLAGTPDGDA